MIRLSHAPHVHMMREVSGKLSFDLGYLYTTHKFELHSSPQRALASKTSTAPAMRALPFNLFLGRRKPGKLLNK